MLEYGNVGMLGLEGKTAASRYWEHRHPACFLNAQAGCPMPLTFHKSSLFVNIAIPKACVIYNAGK
jgi:hypothetical protein